MSRRISAPRRRPTFFRLRLKAIGFALLVVLPFATSRTQAATLTGEIHQVQAVFILNFAKFTEWPPHVFADAGSPFVIGIPANHPIAPGLRAAIAGEQVHGRAIVLRELAPADDPQGCHVLFVGSPPPELLRQTLARLAGTATLTVGETNDFCRRGGMVNFILPGNNLRFEINPKAAALADLRLSAKLLQLARIVDTGA